MDRMEISLCSQVPFVLSLEQNPSQGQKRSDECHIELDPRCIPGHPTQPCHHANMCTTIVNYLQRKTEGQPDLTFSLAPCHDPQNPTKEEPTLTMFVLTRGQHSFLDKVAHQFLSAEMLDGARINMTLDYFGPSGKGLFLRCGYENGLGNLVHIAPSHWSASEYRMGTYAPFVGIPEDWVSDWNAGVPFTGKLSLSLIINNAGLNNFFTFNHRMGIDQRGAHMRYSLENGVNTDFYLVTSEGTRIGCHRSILMERSPMFLRRLGNAGAPGENKGIMRVPMDEIATRAFLKYIYFWEIVDPLNDSWLAITLLQVGEAYQMWDLVLEMQHLMLAKSWTEGGWMGMRSAAALFQMGVSRRKCGHCATNPVQAAWDQLCWKSVWLLYWYSLTLAVADFNELFAKVCEFSPELYWWLYMEFERRLGKDERMSCALQAALEERDENNNF